MGQKVNCIVCKQDEPTDNSTINYELDSKQQSLDLINQSNVRKLWFLYVRGAPGTGKETDF